jgi:hypothetical protein
VGVLQPEHRSVLGFSLVLRVWTAGLSAGTRRRPVARGVSWQLMHRSRRWLTAWWATGDGKGGAVMARSRGGFPRCRVGGGLGQPRDADAVEVIDPFCHNRLTGTLARMKAIGAQV